MAMKMYQFGVVLPIPTRMIEGPKDVLLYFRLFPWKRLCSIPARKVSSISSFSSASANWRARVALNMAAAISFLSLPTCALLCRCSKKINEAATERMVLTPRITIARLTVPILPANRL